MTDLLAVFPVVFTITVALLFRRTLVALGLGILCASIILFWGAPLEMLGYVVENGVGQLYQQGSWQWWHLNVLAAMVLLGVLTSLLSHSGAVTQFADWLYLRITSQRQARLAVVALGFLVFIDGIFSCLANGSVSRPLAQRYRIGSGQLAYLVDATASPLCSLVPFSSWGPYVMALIAGIGWLAVEPAVAFAQVASHNLYAIATLMMAIVVAFSGFGFAANPITNNGDIPEQALNPNPWPLGLPILTLLLGSLGLMLYSGAQGSEQLSLMAMFSNADIGAAMRDGCAAAVVMAVIGATVGTENRLHTVPKALVAGLKNIAPAIAIILFTWMIGRAISDLGSGKVLASYAADHLSPQLLLPGMFLLCTVIAFSTGSSWGTFALMIPIGAEIANGVAPDMVLLAISAVMAGSVFGDHCSPISDTTVLAATASGCEPHHHVITQLPLALISAALALLGFTAISWGIGLATVLVCLGLVLTLLALSAKGRSQ